MKLVTFRRHGYPEPGVLVGDEIIALKRNGFDDLISVIAGGEDAQLRIAEWMRRLPGSEVVRAEDARLTAPIPRPPKIICVGLNYRDHAAEAGLEIPDVPTIFSKFPTASSGRTIPSCCPGSPPSRTTRRNWPSSSDAAGGTFPASAGASTCSAIPVSTT